MNFLKFSFLPWAELLSMQMAGKTALPRIVGDIIIAAACEESGGGMADLANAVKGRIVDVAAPGTGGGKAGGCSRQRDAVSAVGLLGDGGLNHCYACVAMRIVAIPAELTAVIARSVIRAVMGGTYLDRTVLGLHNTGAIGVIAGGTGLVADQAVAVLAVGAARIGQKEGVGGCIVRNVIVVAIRARVAAAGGTGKVGGRIAGSGISAGSLAVARSSPLAGADSGVQRGAPVHIIVRVVSIQVTVGAFHARTPVGDTYRGEIGG